MKNYTIAERQAIKDRLASEEHFNRDRELFAQIFPHHPLNAELARVNRVNKASLCRRMIYQMLQKVDEAAILEWRESGAGVADKHETDTGHIRDDKRTITGPGASSQRNGRSGLRQEGESAAPTAPVKKAGKMEEFPGINWLNNESEDIQLAILLYDERINTWQQLCALRQEIDNYPEKALAIADLDDRNRMAHHELEVFEKTGIFPCKHPMAVKFMAERKKLSEWRTLKQKDPKGFMKQVANIEHNITRYRSQISKDKLTDEKRASIARNLANAERMHELMMQVVKE